MAKDPNKVRGMAERCPSFEQCPICYGCRAYRSDLMECSKCAENLKANVCINKTLHRPDLMSKMVVKNQIKISGDVEFKSRCLDT